MHSEIHNETTNIAVLSETQAHEIGRRVIELIDGDSVLVDILHTVNQITRFANNQLLASEDGDEIQLFVQDQLGRKKRVRLNTNQLDDALLRRLFSGMNARARDSRGLPAELLSIPVGRQTYPPAPLWRASTIAALETRPAVIDIMTDRAQAAGLTAAGFVGRMARARFSMNKGDDMQAYYRETDCEVTMTARSRDGKASGWHGQAHREWSRIDPATIADHAIDICRKSVGAVALEPGRRTAIFGPLAAVHLLRHIGPAFDAFATRFFQSTPFWDAQNQRSKVGLRQFDPRIEMSSDPVDPESGSCPYIRPSGIPDTANRWIEHGVLMDLAHSPDTAKMYDHAVMAAVPYALRVRAQPNADGTAPVTQTVEEMIAGCKEGIYVNHVSGIEQLDSRTGLITGVTRDGCFLVKDGKIARPVKNFRFVESPWFFLNRLEALSASSRAAFGYAPPSGMDWTQGWPRPPMVVPAIMVRDFNFMALADAV